MTPRKTFKGIKLFDGVIYSPGSRIEIDKEVVLSNIKFKVYKFNNRPKPERANRTVIFSCFSEFGSEIVGCLYCIPKLMQSKYLGYYSIAIGWYGREFLYRHLVDEYWEIDESCQWLRDYCRAFHHTSRNLRLVEKAVKKYGIVAGAGDQSCVFLQDIMPKIKEVKPYAVYPKVFNPEKLKQIAHFLSKPRMVGVVARNRRCYGRNLDISFYKKLIDNLEKMGYNPVWLGEKATTHECPYPHILNFRDSEHASDLEKTLLLVSNLEFTVQLYTASSRLAGLVGTPYIIVESPEQICSIGVSPGGQEGMRLNLCTKGNKKLIIAHFKSLDSNHQSGLDLIERAIMEMNQNNYNDIVGDVIDFDFIERLKMQNLVKIGG
jgi:hypothetical protein